MGDTRLYPDCKLGLKARYVSGVLTFSQSDAPWDPRQGKGIGVKYNFTSTNLAQQDVVDNGNMRGLSVVFNANANLQFFSTAIRGAVVIGANNNPRNPRGVHGVLDMSTAGTTRVQGSGFGILAQLITQPSDQNTGTLAVLQCGLTCTALYSSTNNAAMSMIRFALGGDAAAMLTYDAMGFLFQFSGFTEGNGNVWSEGADQAATGGLRIQLPGGLVRYLLYSSVQPT
jgi:hypothetical protein